MSVTTATFRADFPEFGSLAMFPENVLNYYIALGGMLLNQRRWGTPSETATSPPTKKYDFGLELFVAHHVTLEKQAMDAASAGAAPGTGQGGAVASKSVGPASVSYDTSGAADLDAGHWNQTLYGRRFINLARIVGIGPIQVGIGVAPPLSGSPWIGPPPWPGWFG